MLALRECGVALYALSAWCAECAAAFAVAGRHGIDTDEARLVAFGHEDHVRLYGRDIFERFASAGLRSLVTRHEELLPDVDAARFGINVLEPFFLFRRSD